ncbi:MAG TPA: hypothetical protein VKB55_10955 [Nocardioidaceae bacterium]|nr:hypothetical protein [Nocardioidaceae bacterium]
MTDVQERTPDEQSESSIQGTQTHVLTRVDKDTPPAPKPQQTQSVASTSVSGRYAWRRQPGPPPSGALPQELFRREGFCLDVDGRYPQMTASGTSYATVSQRYHWIASLTEVGSNHWTGSVWYRDGSTSLFPYTAVDIVATPSSFPAQRQATVTFSGGGQTSFTRTYAWKAATYHPVEFEYDSTADSHPVTSIGSCDHPNRPASMDCEDLSIERVFQRAGFRVSRSDDDSVVPLSGAGSNARWSDSEMHDAMQTYWSRFANAPQWALWTFWAALHEQGTSLGGIMFDDIGPNHRQGTAIFTEAFIKNPPAGDAAPDAWVRRMRFWTATHEMGHAFNLAHAWQKSLGTPWIPMADEPESRSFMNYPYNVQGGQSAFFADFDYRFSDSELLFMRHAPARFVEMGNADWFDDHAFEAPDQDGAAATSALELVVRANREHAVFEFLEPVTLEVKLTNHGTEPTLVPSTVLDPQGLIAIVKRHGRPARQWHPYARYCHSRHAKVLGPGESSYESLPVYAGLNGWDLSQPGVYDVQVAAEIDGALVTSRPLRLRVRPPQSREAENIAQEFFSEEVGRTLAFGGTEVLETANETLRETVDRLPDSRAARHASAALANPLASAHKVLDIPDTQQRLAGVAKVGGSVRERPARVDDAVQMLDGLTDPATAETMGHIAYRRRVESATKALAESGATEPAAEIQQSLHDVLAERGVLSSVLDDVSARADAYRSGSVDPE